MNNIQPLSCVAAVHQTISAFSNTELQVDKKQVKVLKISDYLSPVSSSYFTILHYLSCFTEEKMLRLYKAHNTQPAHFKTISM